MTNWQDLLIGSLFPAVPTPLKNDGTPDFDALEIFAHWLVHEQVDGVAAWTEVDNIASLPIEDRIRILEIWRIALGDGFTLVTAVSDLETAKKAVELSDFLLLSCSKDAGESIIERCKQFIDLGRPVLLDYWSESPDRNPFDLDTLNKLLDIPEVAGIRLCFKDQFIQLQDLVTHILLKHPQKVILTGTDRMYGYSLYRGCHGALTGLGCIFPDFQRELIDSWFMRETTLFLEMSRKVDHIAEALSADSLSNYRQRLLAGLAYLGKIPSQPDQLSPVDKVLVTATLDVLGAPADVKS